MSADIIRPAQWVKDEHVMATIRPLGAGFKLAELSGGLAAAAELMRRSPAGLKPVGGAMAAVIVGLRPK